MASPDGFISQMCWMFQLHVFQDCSWTFPEFWLLTRWLCNGGFAKRLPGTNLAFTLRVLLFKVVVLHFVDGLAKNLRGFIIVWSRTRWLNLLARKRRLWSSLLRAIDRALAKNTRNSFFMVGYLLQLLWSRSWVLFGLSTRSCTRPTEIPVESRLLGLVVNVESYNCLLFFVSCKVPPQFFFAFQALMRSHEAEKLEAYHHCQQNIQLVSVYFGVRRLTKKIRDLNSEISTSAWISIIQIQYTNSWSLNTSWTATAWASCRHLFIYVDCFLSHPNTFGRLKSIVLKPRG